MKHHSDSAAKGAIHVSSRNRGITLVQVVVCLGIVVLLIALLLPISRSAPEAKRRNTCLNNLKRIALALHNYHDVYQTFPPLYTVDTDGKPLHSWRTLILPYLEEGELYEKVDLSKPWDDPANAKVFKTGVSVYRCPKSEIEPNETPYLAIVAPDGIFQPNEPRPLSDVTDTTSNTIMLVEVPTDQSVPWMSPQDANEELFMAIGPNSNLSHAAGFMVALADGSVRFMDAELPPDKRRALITIAGGDPVDLDE
jgi:hypothetical protein